jgi:carbon monoxide dehydrogenase subunit G
LEGGVGHRAAIGPQPTDGHQPGSALRLQNFELEETCMSLLIEGEERIRAPVAKVWEALNDPEVLKVCIPGCQSLEKKSDNELAATVVLKIGPIKANFVGEVTLTNLNPPNSYTISGEGKGGIAGFARGGADVTLAADGDDDTVLTYTAKADVGGKIAQLGSRLITSTSKKLAGQFFSSFNEKVSAG